MLRKQLAAVLADDDDVLDAAAADAAMTISTELVMTVSFFLSLSSLATNRAVELSSSIRWSPSSTMVLTWRAMAALASTLVLLRMV